MQDGTSKFHEVKWPEKQRSDIRPFFLPFLGCKARCIFCAQELQTGVTATDNYSNFISRLMALGRSLQDCLEIGHKPPELAFYGGTFMALPQNFWKTSLETAYAWQKAGLISSWRCSTRPDGISRERLRAMADCGCTLVELGIQSFSSRALTLSGRGYDCEQVFEAIQKVTAAGVKAGAQLMPGMPGSIPEIFLQDVRTALSARVACMRLYPCLVIDGSALASLWQNGAFKPWSLETTLDTLAQAWLMALQADTPVIRMGLAPEAGLEKAILAGPKHASLGSRVIGRALLSYVKSRVHATARLEVWLPPALHGCVWGWQGELRPFWQRLNLAKMNFWRKNSLRFEWE